MVLVRIVFQIKWGKAGEVAKLMSESVGPMSMSLGARRVRVLTDLSGPFNTVVQELEVDSLAEWEANRTKLYTHPDFLKIQPQMQELLKSGYQEFYTIEYTS